MKNFQIVYMNMNFYPLIAQHNPFLLGRRIGLCWDTVDFLFMLKGPQVREFWSILKDVHVLLALVNNVIFNWISRIVSGAISNNQSRKFALISFCRHF